MTLELHGYRYSVYLRIVAMTLTEKNLAWTHVEVDPFAETIPQAYLALNPFGRVPTLVHDGFVLYETTAITRYVDEAFAGLALQPADPQDRARMNQMIAVADSYGYWPMVRQVFSHRVFRPAQGTASDEAVIAEGLRKSKMVFAALDGLASGGQFLAGPSLSLADLHFGAMVAYFTAAAEGRAELSCHPKLSDWWAAFSGRASLLRTEPGLP
ncbi:glutathione S-transferase family protein [Mesorhizobium sp. KR9-304]|uniref:glutathione S-transferase family protein n=1 Tax=Mesorhizobium sp. KR9-304 TaxID=3156614 RepID=UPI0032B34D73